MAANERDRLMKCIDSVTAERDFIKQRSSFLALRQSLYGALLTLIEADHEHKQGRPTHHYYGDVGQLLVQAQQQNDEAFCPNHTGD